jgi:hypothetical protein
MSYDTIQFYNNALAIVAGCGAAALAFRLLPPLSPAVRTRRLLALTLRDLCRLATGPIRTTVDDWEARFYARLVVLPDQADPLQRSQLLAALSVGSETIRLRRLVGHLPAGNDLDAAIAAFLQGNTPVAIARPGHCSTSSSQPPQATGCRHPMHCGRASSVAILARAAMRPMQLGREWSPPPGLRLPQAELSRKSNQVARGRIRRFESYMPIQAVRL